MYAEMLVRVDHLQVEREREQEEKERRSEKDVLARDDSLAGSWQTETRRFPASSNNMHFTRRIANRYGDVDQIPPFQWTVGRLASGAEEFSNRLGQGVPSSSLRRYTRITL